MIRALLLMLLWELWASPVWAGASLTFNGTTDIGDCGSDTSLDDLTNFTWAAWIKPASMGEGSNGIILRKEGAAGVFIRNFRFDVNGTNSLNIGFECGTTDKTRRTSNNAVTLNAWQFVAVVSSNSCTATASHIYVNGTEASYASSVNGTNATASTDASGNQKIGNNTGATVTFDGQIAYAHVYNRQLSVGELKQIQQRPGSIVNGLVMFQDLMTTGGADLASESLGVNDCTYTGTAASSDGPPISLAGGAE